MTENEIVKAPVFDYNFRLIGTSLCKIENGKPITISVDIDQEYKEH